MMNESTKVGYCDLFWLDTDLLESSISQIVSHHRRAESADSVKEQVGVIFLLTIHDIPKRINRFNFSLINSELVKIQRSANIVLSSFWCNGSKQAYQSAHDAVWEQGYLISSLLFREGTDYSPPSTERSKLKEWLAENAKRLTERIESFHIDHDDWQKVSTQLKNESILLREFAVRSKKPGLPVLKTTTDIAKKVEIEELEPHHKEKLGPPYKESAGRRPATYNIADRTMFDRLKNAFPKVSFADWEKEVVPN